MWSVTLDNTVMRTTHIRSRMKENGQAETKFFWNGKEIISLLKAKILVSMLCNNKMAKRILSTHVCLLLRKLRCMYRVLFYTHNVHGGDESNNHECHFYFYVTQKKKRLHVFINIAVYIFRADRQFHLLGCPFLSLSKSKNGLINICFLIWKLWIKT